MNKGGDDGLSERKVVGVIRKCLISGCFCNINNIDSNNIYIVSNLSINQLYGI